MLCGTILSMLASTQHFGDSSIAAVDKTPSDVIIFWFGHEWYEDGMDAKEYADQGIARWFFGGPSLDAECCEFIPLIRAAGAGNLRGEAWDDVPGLIARLVLLDQLTRNAFRGTPEAFAYDRAAQEVAVRLLDRFAARPADLPWPAAIFIATSLLHAEDVALHDRAAAFLREHTGEFHAAVLSDKVLPQLESHTRVLKRFGRYPHRNQALGRETTAAESAWLASDDVPGWARSQIDVASGGTVDKM
jgi:uncharacterized protein (DUF924 family)